MSLICFPIIIYPHGVKISVRASQKVYQFVQIFTNWIDLFVKCTYSNATETHVVDLTLFQFIQHSLHADLYPVANRYLGNRQWFGYDVPILNHEHQQWSVYLNTAVKNTHLTYSCNVISENRRTLALHQTFTTLCPNTRPAFNKILLSMSSTTIFKI